MSNNSITDIASLYQQILGRAPDTQGALNWAQAFGPTIEASEIEKFRQEAAPELAITGYGRTAAPAPSPAPAALTSSTAAATPPSNTASATPIEDPIVKLYKDVLDRAPDEAGREYWSKQFGNTIDQNKIAQFKEAAAQEIYGPDIFKLYKDVFNRAPDKEGLEYWSKQFGKTIDENEAATFKKASEPELYGPDYNNPNKPYLDFFKSITPNGELTPGNFGRQTALDLAWSGKLDQDSYTKVLQNSPNRTEIESIRGLGKDILDKAPKKVDPRTLDFGGENEQAYANVDVGNGNGTYARYDRDGNLLDFTGTQVWPLVPDGKGGYKTALPKDTRVFAKWDANGKANLNPIAERDNSLAGFIKQFGIIPDIALAVATGGSSLPVQLAAKAALDLARGATPAQLLQGGVASYLSAGIADYTGLSSAIKSIDSKLLQDVARNATMGGLSAGISGRDIGKGITVGAVSGAVSNIGNQYLTDTSLSAVQRNALMGSATAYAQSIASGQSNEAALKNAMMAGGKAAGTQFAKDLDKEYGITESLRQLPTRQPTNSTVTALDNGLEIGDNFIPFDVAEGSITSLIDDTDYTGGASGNTASASNAGATSATSDTGATTSTSDTGGTGATFDIDDMNYGSTSTTGEASENTTVDDNQTITTSPGEEPLEDLSKSGVFMPDGSYKTWAELDEMAGVEPGSIYTDGGTTITEEELQAILSGTGGARAGGSGGRAGGSGATPRTTTPRATTPRTTTTQRTTTPRTTTPGTTTPRTTTPGTTRTTTPNTTDVIQNILRSLPQSKTQNMDLLGLLALLAGGGSQAAPTVVSPDVSEIKLMEDIFGTELSARPPSTKKYYGGGDVDSLLKIIRS